MRPVAASGGVRTDGLGANVIAAVRELLSYVPVPGEGVGREGATAPGGAGALPAVMDQVRDPTALARFQSLALLGAPWRRSAGSLGARKRKSSTGWQPASDSVHNNRTATASRRVSSDAESDRTAPRTPATMRPR